MRVSRYENVWYLFRIQGILVTVQNSPKHLLLRAYEHDSTGKNPIAEGDLHGFLPVSVQVLNRYGF